MNTYESGTITRVSVKGGLPDNAKVTRFGDVKHLFSNLENTSYRDDDIVYFVERVAAADSQTPEFSITTIMPGNISGECFFTRGHDHKPEKGETYFCIAGQGGLIVEKDGGSEWLPMSPGDVIQLKSGWAHRTVNTGDTPLIFVGQYITPFEVDYGISERGFKMKVFKNGSNNVKLTVQGREVG